MAASLPLQVAETIQTAHINWAPSAEHDTNPSTAASKKEPVTLDEPTARELHDAGIDEGDEDEIPYRVLRPKQRSNVIPPLSDLRFEQSYLHSISEAKTWSSLAWITTRDQVMMPFVQGILYNLAIFGWQHWNRTAQYSGNSIGARIRRWWWGVNNWPIPSKK